MKYWGLKMFFSPLDIPPEFFIKNFTSIGAVGCIQTGCKAPGCTRTD
jgi:hypothetical protein